MRTLYFESAGMEGTQINDVPNCRLRTRIKNKEGRLIYLELGGTAWNKYMPSSQAGFKAIGRVDHCFYCDSDEDKERNYSKELQPIEHEHFEYTQANILKLVNKKLKCSFERMECSESLRVHETENALA